MNAPATAASMSAEQLEWLPYSAITPSESQVQQLRRKRYSMQSLADLRDSIAKLGIQQPIVVRKLKAMRGLATYEIVFGERRWRASGQAGVKHVPAIVRDLTDIEALEAQMVENIQREELHPLEEAAGYEELIRVGKLKKEDLGARLGMSRSWVYSRMNLLKLDGDARAALEDGRLDVSRALVVATVAQPNQREQALKLALALHDYTKKPLYSVRELRHKIVEDKLSLPLKAAPFDVRDATLVPDMGDCSACQYRTGNCDPEALDPDVCTNLSCYHLKVQAHAARHREAAEAAGQQILTGEAARKLSPSVKTVYDHVDLDNRCIADDFPEEGPKRPADLDDDDAWENHPLMLAWREREALWQPRTYRQLLEGLKYKPVLIDDPKTKQLRELLPFREAQKLLKQKGIDLPSYYNRKRPTPVKQRAGSDAEREESWQERQKREREKRELEGRVRLAIIKEAFPKVKAKLTREVLANAIDRLENYIDEALEAIFGHKDLRKLKEEDLARILVAIDALIDTSQTYGPPKALLALATAVKVDAASIRKRVTKEQAAKEDKK